MCIQYFLLVINEYVDKFCHTLCTLMAPIQCGSSHLPSSGQVLRRSYHTLRARTKCITMEKNYDFFVRHLAQLQNSGLNALQKKAPFITKKVMDLVVYLLAGLNAVLFYFVILEKVMDLVVYLLAGLNAVLF